MRLITEEELDEEKRKLEELLPEEYCVRDVRVLTDPNDFTNHYCLRVFKKRNDEE